jgi:hypothetical protein
MCGRKAAGVEWLGRVRGGKGGCGEGGFGCGEGREDPVAAAEAQAGAMAVMMRGTCRGIVALGTRRGGR